MKLEMQKTKEELDGEKMEEAEIIQKEEEGRKEVAVAVEIVKRSEGNVSTPVTKEGEDENLKMRYQDVTPEPA